MKVWLFIILPTLPLQLSLKPSKFCCVTDLMTSEGAFYRMSTHIVQKAILSKCHIFTYLLEKNHSRIYKYKA